MDKREQEGGIMKTVKEVIIEHKKRLYGVTDNESAIDALFEIVTGITEHLEAAEERHEHIDENGNLVDVGAYSQQLRREAWIEALRWADRVTHPVEYSAIKMAITRITSGGDL